MTRNIILAVIFSAVAITNFSFAPSSSSPTTVVTPKKDKGWIIACVFTGGCRYCGGVQWDSRTRTTICLQSACPGITVTICVSFLSKVNPVTSKYEVDESSVSFDYSDPDVKAGADEAQLKADLIQQINAQL